MPTTVTLYHYNELSDEAKAKALAFWKEQFQDTEVDVYNDIKELLQKKVERIVRVCLKDLNIPNQDIRFFYNSNCNILHERRIQMESFAFKGVFKDIFETFTDIGPNLKDEYLYFQKTYGDIEIKAILNQRESRGIHWSVHKYDTKVQLKIKNFNAYQTTTDDFLRGERFRKDILGKLQSHIDYITTYITDKVNNEINVISAETFDAKQNSIQEQIHAKLENRAKASNMNYLVNGDCFVDQYYYDTFPSADPRWDD